MGLFDFLKSNSDKSNIDLSDMKFISDDHIRYEHGQDVSGHNKDCWRGLRVQNNISGGQGYTVTMYNLDGNHSLWGDNIQMAPKQMKIIEQSNSLIRLRGYGTDQMGASFADYGLTLHLNNNSVEKITLHMHDRNVDIVYFKADGAKTQASQQQATSVKTKQSIPTHSSNLMEIISLSQTIHSSSNISTLTNLYNQKGNYNHPQICYDFGMAFLVRGNKQLAKQALIQGALYGMQYPCSIYNNSMIDAVGQCFAHLLTQFPIANSQSAEKATSLAYIYLSRCIELHPRQAQDSYRTRALLFKDHESPMTVQRFILLHIGMGVLTEPFIISDFYFASQATDSPHHSALESARRIHQNLDDMTIGGKDADDYTLNEMAEFGEKRHYGLFKTLEQKYKNGEFDMTIDELKNMNS